MMTTGVAHAVTTETITTPGGRMAFVASCSCGWRSRHLTTAGMAGSVGARHRDEPTWDG